MWYHIVGNLIFFHMTPLLCREDVPLKYHRRNTKCMYKTAAILKKAPSRISAQDTACLPHIFLFPMKNWSRKTTWKFLLLQVAPSSVITRTIMAIIINASFIGVNQCLLDFPTNFSSLYCSQYHEMVFKKAWTLILWHPQKLISIQNVHLFSFLYILNCLLKNCRGNCVHKLLDKVRIRGHQRRVTKSNSRKTILATKRRTRSWFKASASSCLC